MDTPWSQISMWHFLSDAAFSGPWTLEMTPRHEVATRKWYRLTWVGEDGQTHTVEASDRALLMKRAAERELAARATEEGSH